MATKGTKKDMLNKLEERLVRSMAEMMEKFRNSVNEATEINMKRVLTSLHASSTVIDSQTDRLNALAQILLDNAICDEDALKAAIVAQKEARIATAKEYLEALRRKQEEEAKEEEAKKEEAAEIMPEEDVVLGAADESVPFTQPVGQHPVEADIFGG